MKKKVLLGLVLLAIIGTGAVFAQTTTQSKSRFPQDFYLVPAGTYTIGRIGGSAYDQPQTQERRVRLQNSFYIAKYTVTIAEFTRVGVGGRMGFFPFSSVHEDQPINGANWWDALRYCNQRSRMDGLTPVYTFTQTRTRSGSTVEVVTWDYTANGWRLPTDAEWEIACRAGTSTNYHYGNSLSSSQARFGDRSGARIPARVGQYQPNAWGLYDMHGNVWEWCWDYWDDFMQGNSTNPRTLPPVETDPRGPATSNEDMSWLMDTGMTYEDFHVVRGGSWAAGAAACSSWFRTYVTAIYRGRYMGDGPQLYASSSLNLQDGSIGFRIARNGPGAWGR